MSESAAVKRAEESIKYTSLFDEIEETFNAISRRAYEIFEGNGKSSGRDLDNWFRAEREFLHPVQINMDESDELLSVKAEVLGFNEKEIEINLEPHRLTITGKRRPRAKKRRERPSGQKAALIRFCESWICQSKSNQTK